MAGQQGTPRHLKPREDGVQSQGQEESPGQEHGRGNVTRRVVFLSALAAVVLRVGMLIHDLFPSHGGGAADTQGTGGTDDSGPSTQLSEEQQFALAVREKVSSLSLEQKVAQLFFATPEALTGVGQVVAAGDDTREALAQLPVGGLCYFSQNLQDGEQTATMLEAVNRYSQDVVGLPLFLSVDEEGGTVSRIGGAEGFDVENVGDMRNIGDAGDPQAAYDVSTAIATYLRPLGFNLDFAPVCDIVNGEGQVMARRSFGTSVDVVAPMVGEAVEGFLDSGLLCCAKHFPGIGGAQGDSETEAIFTGKTLDELRQEELVPFERAMDAGVPFVMVGHLSCPNVTGDDTPASLSKVMVTDVLRDELGFDGIIITDSLSMGAVTGLYSDSELGVAALQAGVDMLLMCPDLNAAYQGVLDAVEAGTISESRIEESVVRIVRTKLEMAG